MFNMEKVLDIRENYHSTVKIECNLNEGTAVCVHSDTLGHLFLTCAHVVQHKTQSVILRYDNRVIKGKVIYATNKNVSCDIAVIICDKIVNIIPCQISNQVPNNGQRVFTVGYACKEYMPSIVLGYVHKKSFSILTTTCHVHIGFSGGPVFSSDGHLLGLTIGKLNQGSMHFVLLSSTFSETINKYIQTKDIKILNDLESKNLSMKVLWKIECHI